MAPRLRSAVLAVTLSGLLVVLGPPTLLATWLLRSPHILFAVAVGVVRGAFVFAGVRIDVAGIERLDSGQNYLFMPNHISNVDPPVLIAALRRDIRMMGKASLFRIPILGQLLRIAGFVPIVRENKEAAIQAVELGAERLRAGLDFAVFPEGTRSRDGRLLPLKKGPFFMALAGGVPIVPVRIDGSREILPRGAKVLHPGRVSVSVGIPIRVADKGSEAEAVREELRRRVAAALQPGSDAESTARPDGLTVPGPRVTPPSNG